MKAILNCLLLVVALLCPGCAANLDATKLGWIQVSQDNRRFVETQSGQPFRPWGFNYDRDHKMRLLEEYWEAQWPTVAGDFREMRALGANVVRIHLQLAKFMVAPDQADERALTQLRKLLALAEETGLHLDLTGLACYRKADVPGWFDALTEQERWKAQANFWRAIARTCAASPAVFCYDLMNEPVVPGKPRQPGDWLVGELAGFHYVQAISLDPAGRARPDVAKAWITALVKAIREEDKRHLITVGLLPNSGEVDGGSGFEPARVADDLDFICVHLYPKSGELAQARGTLRKFRIGKPLIVEETFPMNCKGEELVQFMRDTRSEVGGWISFYWGRTPDELTDGKTIGEAITRDWLKLFQRANPWIAR